MLIPKAFMVAADWRCSNRNRAWGIPCKEEESFLRRLCKRDFQRETVKAVSLFFVENVIPLMNLKFFD